MSEARRMRRAGGSTRPGRVGGAQIRPRPDERGDVTPSAMLKRVVGGNLHDDVGPNTDDVDVLATPVADVAAADNGRPRVVVVGRGEQRCEQGLLDGIQCGGAADYVQGAVAVEAQNQAFGLGDGAGDSADDEVDAGAVAVLEPVAGAPSV